MSDTKVVHLSKVTNMVLRWVIINKVKAILLPRAITVPREAILHKAATPRKVILPRADIPLKAHIILKATLPKVTIKITGAAVVALDAWACSSPRWHAAVA
jgi:hypothetical protein